MKKFFKDSLAQIKAKYLNMDLEEKRKLYSCMDTFVMLNSIPTWSQYVTKNQIASSLPEEMNEHAFSTNEDINSKVSLWQGDITKLEIDGIVNAANETLLGGGGVDHAIHEAAGEDLLRECRTLKGCETGSAKITGGYRLPAKYVVHAVGPREQNSQLLSQAYQKSLDLMVENNLKTIAFPSISTGIFGYPMEDASHVALKTVRDFLTNHKEKVDRVIFAVYSDSDKAVYKELMLRYFPVPNKNESISKTSDPLDDCCPNGKL